MLFFCESANSKSNCYQRHIKPVLSFRESMEASLYDAIKEFVKSRTFTIPIKNDVRRIWKRRMRYFSVKENVVLWRGQVVPTVQQVEESLFPLHYKEGKHCTTLKLLRKALSDKGFALPPFMGGLDRACLTLVF